MTRKVVPSDLADIKLLERARRCRKKKAMVKADTSLSPAERTKLAGKWQARAREYELRAEISQIMAEEFLNELDQLESLQRPKRSS